MASGKLHTLASIAATVPTAVVTGAVTGDVGLAALAGLGCASGVFLSPDLDVDGRSESELILWRAAVPLGVAFTLAWGPYAVLIRHRSPLSHLPVLGTLLRVGYLALWAALVQLHLRAVGLSLDLFWWTRYPQGTLAWVAGLAVSDFGHWVLDGFPA